MGFIFRFAQFMHLISYWHCSALLGYFGFDLPTVWLKNEKRHFWRIMITYRWLYGCLLV